MEFFPSSAILLYSFPAEKQRIHIFVSRLCQSTLLLETPQEKKDGKLSGNSSKTCTTAKQGQARENTSEGALPSGNGWGRSYDQARRARKQEIRETDGAVRQ